MTQIREKGHSSSTVERSEQMLTSVGTHLGQWAGQTVLRLRQTTQTLRATGQTDKAAPVDEPAHAAATQEPSPSLAKAEIVVDQLAQRVALWTLKGNSSLQRTMARLREDAEDMWVEAQEIQRAWQERYGHARDGVR